MTDKKLTSFDKNEHVGSRTLHLHARNIFVTGNVAESSEKGLIEQALFGNCGFTVQYEQYFGHFVIVSYMVYIRYKNYQTNKKEEETPNFETDSYEARS